MRIEESLANIQFTAVDVLVIGAGASGLRLAIELADRGVGCLVVGKRAHGDAHTTLAAGGINAALGGPDADDSWAIHAADTTKEGHFVSQPDAVQCLAQESPARVLELASWGCPFERTADGKLAARFFGAQTYRRTHFVGDCTGAAILRTLVEQAEQRNVRYLEHLFVFRLIRKGPRVVGAVGFEKATGRLRALVARAVVLAAGGSTAAYARSSSRDDENTGDGAALAYMAGATLRDMEFVQFHPTGMVHPPQMRGTLVSEAVRGEGGQLHNRLGERFMARYSPEHLELDARDVVARAIFQEIEGGRGTSRGGVWLDVSHVGSEHVQRRLPRMLEQFHEQGLDIRRKPMEVAPTAHYAMGGVKVRFDTGATDVPGLYAIGEVTSGVHGANRLGGNSLAETLVFGRNVGVHLASCVATLPQPSLCREDLSSVLLPFAADGTSQGPHHPGEVRQALGELLWRYAGIVRDEEGLQAGLRELDGLQHKANQLQVAGDLAMLEEALNLRFCLLSGEAILRAALLRRESRGAHYRRDAPQTDQAWRKNILLYGGAEGHMHCDTEAVPPLSHEVRNALMQARGVDYHLLE